MTGPGAVPGTDNEAPRQRRDGTAAVAALVADGLDEWLVERLDAAGGSGMHINAIGRAVWQRYGRTITPIFLEEVCNRLVAEERIGAGPGWLDYRPRQEPQTSAAADAADNERQD